MGKEELQDDRRISEESRSATVQVHTQSSNRRRDNIQVPENGDEYTSWKELLLRKEEKVLLHLIKEIRQLRREKNMNEDMKIGAKIALEGVKEELIKVRAELKRKGYDNRRGFTTIEAYIDDSIKELK